MGIHPCPCMEGGSAPAEPAICLPATVSIDPAVSVPALMPVDDALFGGKSGKGAKAKSMK